MCVQPLTNSVQYQTAHHKQTNKSHNSSHSSNLPLFNSSGVSAQGSGMQSSLPPIAGGGVGGGASTLKNDTHRSNRSLQQPKRRKKYKTQELNKSTKRTGQEQVLRTYGLAGKTMASDSRSEVKIDGKPAGSNASHGSYNHPVRIWPLG